MAKEPNCQHCKRQMQVNKYQKPSRNVEVYTFACYKCGTVNIQTLKAR